MADGKLITVLGGTGFLGRRVVSELLARGHRVRIAARHPARCKDLAHDPGAEPVQVDIQKPETVAAALDGASGAVNATSLYLERGNRTFEAVHVDAAGRVAELAREAGVDRFVQLSGIGADADARNDYIRARGQGERAVQDVFGASMIVRSAVMFGQGDALVSAILNLARRSPAFPLFGDGQTRLQPVFVEDVARAIVSLLTDGAPRARYEIAGPRVMSYRELVSDLLKVTDLERPLIAMPFPVWRMAASVSEHLPGAPLSRSQIALIRKDNVADGSQPGLSDLNIEPVDIVDYVRQRQKV